MVYFIYDVDNIIGLVYNNEIIANYEYDSFGNIISITDNNNNQITDESHIANINPFRYRSYYYDFETNLYYLNSRYYNPKWGRFISADSVLIKDNSILGNNLYTYANNNPIMNTDNSGNFSINKLWNDWKNGFDIMVDGIKSGFNSVVNMGKSAYNGVKKVYNSIKSKFVFEAGVGIGVGGEAKVGSYGIGGTISKTLDWNYKNDEAYMTSTTSFEGIIGGGKLSASTEIVHKLHDQGWKNGPYHDNPFSMPWQVSNCPYTSANFQIGSKLYEFGGLESSTDGNFIGISLSGYLGVGGHVKIGFNL